MKGREFAIFLLIAAAAGAVSWRYHERDTRLESFFRAQLEFRDRRLMQQEQEIAALKKALAEAHGREVSVPAAATPSPQPSTAVNRANPPEDRNAGPPPQSARRLALIKKFIDLGSDESARLADYLEQHDGTAQPEVLAQAIEAGVGKEQAEFYREQVKKAFDRAEREENEKEILLLSRRMALSSEQENSLAEIYRQAEELDEQGEEQAPHDALAPGASKQMERYLQSVKRRRTFIDERVKPLLTAEQYRVYVEFQAQSNEQELELWHGKE